MKQIYVTACAPVSEGGGIYRYALSDAGKLTLLDITPCDLPMYLLPEAQKMHTLLKKPYPDSPNSAFLSFYLCKSGALTRPSALKDTQGEVACHLTRFQGKLCCVNYVSGSVLIGNKLITHIGSGNRLPRQASAHTHYCAPSPDGKFLLVCDLGLDRIFAYRKNGEMASATWVTPGTGARHWVANENGKYLYCVNELRSSVTVLSYDNGTLISQKCYRALPEEQATRDDNLAAAIKRNGAYLYVSNRGHDSVAQFRILGDGAELEPLEIVPCGGKAPRDITVAGDYLISTNQDSNTITVLAIRDGKIGEVVEEISAPCPICAVCLER